jgi:hypothetical protein
MIKDDALWHHNPTIFNPSAQIHNKIFFFMEDSLARINISAIDDVFIRKDLAEGKYKPDFAALKK